MDRSVNGPSILSDHLRRGKGRVFLLYYISMSLVLRILIGLVVMAAGFGIIIKTDLVRSWFGEIAWAERKLGPGGTRTFYKLIGLAVCVIGVFIATNIISDIMNGLVGIFIR